ncbi:hypothetical protein VE03_02683 [Pseudogymnoascus sp. 23342-1-I1]|nr:hypothetical protein VE03_02683 [Pseudogymnoascus sp. 23342-1-I1]
MADDNDTNHLPRDAPIRVLADISTSSLETSDKFREVRDLLDEVIPVIFKDPTAETDAPVEVNLLAIEIRGRHTFAIFDANYDDYDFLTAHEVNNNQLPVYSVRLKKRGMTRFGRAPKLDEMINGIVSELHRLNGYDVQPPYTRDHMLGPIMYRFPRGLKMAVPTEVPNKEAEDEEIEGKVADEKEAGETVSDEAASKEGDYEEVEGKVADDKEAGENVSDEEA